MLMEQKINGHTYIYICSGPTKLNRAHNTHEFVPLQRHEFVMLCRMIKTGTAWKQHFDEQALAFRPPPWTAATG